MSNHKPRVDKYKLTVDMSITRITTDQTKSSQFFVDVRVGNRHLSTPDEGVILVRGLTELTEFKVFLASNKLIADVHWVLGIKPSDELGVVLTVGMYPGPHMVVMATYPGCRIMHKATHHDGGYILTISKGRQVGTLKNLHQLGDPVSR